MRKIATNIFMFMFSLCMSTGKTFAADESDKKNKQDNKVVSNLSIKIKCNPVQQIENIELQTNSSTCIQPNQNENGIAQRTKNLSAFSLSTLKYCVMGAAVAGAGFYRKNVQTVAINVASKIQTLIQFRGK